MTIARTIVTAEGAEDQQGDSDDWMTMAQLRDNQDMNGIQFVTDEKGRKVAVQIDLKKHGAIWEDFQDALIAMSRRNEKSISYEQYRASRSKRARKRA
jgi:hypothetical protein